MRLVQIWVSPKSEQLVPGFFKIKIQSLLWATRQTPTVSPWKLKKDVLPSILAQRIAIPERRAGHRKTQTELRTWLGRADVQSCGFTPGPGPAIQQCEIRKAWELWADCGLHNLFLPVLTVSLQCHQIGSWQQIHLLIRLETSSRDPEIRSSGHKIHVGYKCWYKDLYLPSPPVYLCQD